MFSDTLSMEERITLQIIYQKNVYTATELVTQR